MSWLSLISGLISLARAITTALHDKALLDAGQAKAIAEQMARASEEVVAAVRAGQEAEEKAKKGEFDPDLFRDKP